MRDARLFAGLELTRTNTNDHPNAPRPVRAIALILFLALSSACTTTLDLRGDAIGESGPAAAVVVEDGSVSWNRWRAGAARTRITSIDGSGNASRYIVDPGVHDLQLELLNESLGIRRTYIGRVAVDLPAGNYTLSGQADGSDFEIVLFDPQTPGAPPIRLATVPAASAVVQRNHGVLLGIGLGVALARCF